MDEKHKQPGFLVALLALLGLFSLPQVVKLQDGGVEATAQERSAEAGGSAAAETAGEIDRDRQDLKPLLDYLRARENTASERPDLKRYLREKLGQTRVDCLVITLPDPVESVASARFDEYLDVVQRAVELQGYILDRSLLPWKPAAGRSEPPPDRTTTVRAFGLELGIKVSTSTPVPEAHAQPGLIVFRHAFPTTRGKKPDEPAILLAFLVPESPIAGIRKSVLSRCLDLVDRFFHGKLTRDSQGGDRRVMHLIAPCFSGSQRSLELALGQWDPENTEHKYHFRVISNSADQIDQDRLQKIFPTEADRHRLTFHSMVHRIHTVKDGLRDYLTGTLGYSLADVAILIESNTGLMQAMVQRERGTDNSPVEFIYPLQVAEVQKVYEKRGLLQRGKLDQAGAAERLVIPPDEAGAPRDLPKSYTPATSAALDEIALTQVLTTIGHRRYRAVGIVATNPFDVVFLAREVSRFCPNARLFTIHADLLAARPEAVADLRGMLVASTYPLYPANQWITTPYRDGPRVFFSNQGAQGLYNAIVAHLWEMQAGDPNPEPRKPAPGPQLLEFGEPYDAEQSTTRRPPVWISAVGQRGLYPIHYVAASRQAIPYLYDPNTSAEGRVVSPWPPTPEDEAKTPEAERAKVTNVGAAGSPAASGLSEQEAAKKSMKSNPHPLFWLLCLFLLFACFWVAGVTRVYVRWATDLEKVELDTRIAYFLGFGHWLRFLNYEVAGRKADGRGDDLEDADQNAPGDDPGLPPEVPAAPGAFGDQKVQSGRQDETRCPPALGAGIYLLLINLVVLALAYYVFSRLLVAMIPLATADSVWRFAGLSVALAAVSVVTGSTMLALLEYTHVSKCEESNTLIFYGFTCAALCFWLSFLIAFDGTPLWRLEFDRVTNLASGVSPVLPLIFLAAALGAWIHAALAGRRFYRMSYLPSSPEAEKAAHTHFEEILVAMRKTRSKVDRLITSPYAAVTEANSFLLAALFIVSLLAAIRICTGGPPRSLEGSWFDTLFWPVFFAIALLIIGFTLQLRVLWRTVERMLHLAVELPLSAAYDRIPTRFKGWFRGEEDFRVRKQLILQQSAALKRRSTGKLKGIFAKLFPEMNDSSGWDQRFRELQIALEGPEGTLDSTRKVYPFLRLIWSALPVEDAPGKSNVAADNKGQTADWLASWPLVPEDRSKIEDQELVLVRDWTRMAEDLIALQIVRLVSPALSQFIPIMQFLVFGACRCFWSCLPIRLIIKAC